MATSCPSLELPQGSVQFDCARGAFSITLGAFHLSALASAVETAEGMTSADQCAWEVTREDECSLALTGEAGGMRLHLAFHARDIELAEGAHVGLELQVRVTSASPLSVERIILFQGGSAPAPEWIYSMAHRDFPMGTVRAAEGVGFRSRSVTGWTKGKQTLFLSFPLRQSFPCALGGMVTGDAVTELRAECTVGLDDITEVVAPPLTLCATDAPHGYLEAHGESQREEPMPPLSPRPVAWNSWDYVRDLVSEEYVLRNLDVIAEDPVLREHVQYIVIDSGWEQRYGDWIPNPRFPHGMEWIAQQIIARGFKAGLWVAPTILENCSVPALWNTELLAHGRAGVPCQAFQCMLRYGFVLDIRKQAARQWLHDLFARYREMGYTYFKTDFLRHISNAVFFNGRRVPKGDLVREVMEVVREAIGPECHLVGCNYPDETGSGLVNSNRISGDISPHWETVRLNARSLGARFWMHQRVWCNDPDFAVCRGPETSDDPDIDRMHAGDIFLRPQDLHAHRPQFLSEIEARTLLSLVILTGGSVTLSDNLPVLNETGLDLLRRTMSARPGLQMRPLDLFTVEVPTLWLQDVTDGEKRLGVVHWGDRPSARCIQLAELTRRSWHRVTDFWTGEELTQSGGEIRIQCAPHETKLLVLADE